MRLRMKHVRYLQKRAHSQLFRTMLHKKRVIGDICTVQSATIGAMHVLHIKQQRQKQRYNKRALQPNHAPLILYSQDK